MNYSHAINSAFEWPMSVQDHVLQSGYPCPIAQAVARHGGLSMHRFSSMRTDAAAVHEAVGTWLSAPHEFRFRSFVAVFPDEKSESIDEFHDDLWTCLSGMRACEPVDRPVPPGTSDDVASPDFTFTIHGTPFFVVGLSPHSPRKARRTRVSGFALNPHQQFEDLRASNSLEAVKHASRARDMQFQGSINPMLSDHGERSAALQYSSMPVTSPSQCPYHAQTKA